MNPKEALDKYRRPIIISIAALALLVFYGIDNYAGFIAKGDVYTYIEIAFALFVPAALLYMLMLLIERNSHE